MAKRESTRIIRYCDVSSRFMYDPETGAITWAVRAKRITLGMLAGCYNDKGYLSIGFNCGHYYGHRVAWVLYTKQDLAGDIEIDHRDGNPSNNRIENLRLAMPMQNKRNMRLPEANTSGHRGVTWVKRRGLWQAQISLKNKCVHLGRFANIEDAIAARKAAESDIFGEFSFEQSRKTA